jgi:hypothetical protein
MVINAYLFELLIMVIQKSIPANLAAHLEKRVQRGLVFGKDDLSEFPLSLQWEK